MQENSWRFHPVCLSINRTSFKFPRILFWKPSDLFQVFQGWWNDGLDYFHYLRAIWLFASIQSRALVFQSMDSGSDTSRKEMKKEEVSFSRCIRVSHRRVRVVTVASHWKCRKCWGMMSSTLVRRESWEEYRRESVGHVGGNLPWIKDTPRKNDADRCVRVGKVGLESDIQPVHDRSMSISLAVW